MVSAISGPTAARCPTLFLNFPNASCPISLRVMLAFFLSNLLNFQYWLTYPWLALLSLFQLWMLVDAVRRREWIWALFILLGWGISALFYYLMVYRAAPSATRGFELPGAYDRRRIKELDSTKSFSTSSVS